VVDIAPFQAQRARSPYNIGVVLEADVFRQLGHLGQVGVDRLTRSPSSL
jgi:hypothetical protein